MRRLIISCCFAPCMAVASTSTDLAVLGQITPPSCNVTLTGEQFDIGVINNGDLNRTTATVLPKTSGGLLSINCSGPAYVAFRGVDNRTSPQSNRYGLGVDSNGQAIGSYSIEMESAQSDALPGKVFYSNDSGATWRSPGLTLDNSTVYIYGINPTTSTNRLLPISDASVALSIIPTISPAKTLDSNAEIQIDGSATIELIYL